MAHQLNEDLSTVSHPQPEPGFTGKQTMEDVVNEEDTDSPAPTAYVGFLDGETSAAPPSECYHQCAFRVSPTCAATASTFHPWQLFHIFKVAYTFPLTTIRRFASTKTVGPSAHPGKTWNSAQTYRRCDCCEEIIKHLKHDLAHQLEYNHTMQGHIEMLSKDLCKTRDEMLSQAKRSQEETDSLLSGFGAQIQVAHTEINQLRSENENLNESVSITSSRNQNLVRQIESLEQEKASASSASGSYLESLATPQLLETAVQGVKDALGSFSKELISLMKLRNWNIIAEARKLQPTVRFSRPSHVKFAFQSHMCRQLFRGFEKEDFDITSGEAQFLSFDRRQAEFFRQYQKLSSLQASELMMDSATEASVLKDFTHYCHKKYIDIVPEDVEVSLFGNIDLRSALKLGKCPECELSQTFLRLSKLVWALHRLAFSFEPHAHVIRVERGAMFDGMYMRSVVIDDERHDDVAGFDVETSPVVGFMLFPGFRVSKCVVKSQVYLHPMVDQE